MTSDSLYESRIYFINKIVQNNHINNIFRYIFLIEGENQVYAFDRDHNPFLVSNLRFPHRKEPRHIRETLLDGEMIIDKVMDNGREQSIPRYLIYDIVKFEVSIVLRLKIFLCR